MDQRSDIQNLASIGDEDGGHEGGNGKGAPSPDHVEYLQALERKVESTPQPGTAFAATPPPPADAVAVRGDEKRKSPRYRCEGGAEFRTEGSGDVRTWARLTEISRNGCYVEMHATSPVNTPVGMSLDVNGFRVKVQGAVRASYPVLGMGIGFTDVSPEDQAKLDDLLRQLASGAPIPAFEAQAPAENQRELLVIDSGSALNALAKFFETNRTLSREEFSHLIGRSQREPSLER